MLSKPAAVLTLLCLAVPSALGAGLTSRIDAVTVYDEGATVTRVARANLSGGAAQVVVGGLIPDLSEALVRVQISGDAELRGVSVSTSQQELAFDAEVRRVRAEIDDVRAKAAVTSDSSRTARLRLKFLEGLAEGYAKESWFEGARGNTNVDSWRAALDLLDEESASAYGTLRNNAAKDREYKLALSRLERELASLRGTERATSQLSLDVNGTGPVAISIDYRVTDANWTSFYESRLDSATGALILVHRAKIRQRTAENWDDVKLTLSTARPTDVTQVAVPSPRFVDLASPVLAARSSAPGRARMDLASPLEAVAIEEVVVTGDNIRRNDSAYGTAFEVTGRTTVDNDLEDGRLVDLQRLRFDAEVRTRIVPRTTAAAFLMAGILNNHGSPLPGAALDMYVDGAFAGSGWMPELLPGATAEIPLGQDRRIEVRVLNQGGESGESGLIGRRMREPTHIRFSIRNRHVQSRNVEVFDYIPVSRHEDVEVTVPRSATKADEVGFRDAPGVVVWRRTVGPDEAWNIRHEYILSYPVDSVISYE